MVCQPDKEYWTALASSVKLRRFRGSHAYRSPPSSMVNGLTMVRGRRGAHLGRLSHTHPTTDQGRDNSRSSSLPTLAPIRASICRMTASTAAIANMSSPCRSGIPNQLVMFYNTWMKEVANERAPRVAAAYSGAAKNRRDGMILMSHFSYSRAATEESHHQARTAPSADICKRKRERSPRRCRGAKPEVY